MPKFVSTYSNLYAYNGLKRSLRGGILRFKNNLFLCRIRICGEDVLGR